MLWRSASVRCLHSGLLVRCRWDDCGGRAVPMRVGARRCLRLVVAGFACGGQALSLRGARPFQREERRWGVKQQVRSVSHDTARLNPAASSPGSSMTPPSCRTLVRYTENCPLNLAGLGRFRLPGSRWNDRETLRRWRAAVSSILRRWEFSQVIAGLRVVCASVSGRLMHLLLAPVTFPHVGIFPRRFAEFLVGSNH